LAGQEAIRLMAAVKPIPSTAEEWASLDDTISQGIAKHKARQLQAQLAEPSTPPNKTATDSTSSGEKQTCLHHDNHCLLFFFFFFFFGSLIPSFFLFVII
jgi:hypothetical protein